MLPCISSPFIKESGGQKKLSPVRKCWRDEPPTVLWCVRIHDTRTGGNGQETASWLLQWNVLVNKPLQMISHRGGSFSLLRLCIR